MGSASCPQAQPTHYRESIGFITGFRGDLLSSAFASRGDLLSSGGGTCCPVDKSATPQAFGDKWPRLAGVLKVPGVQHALLYRLLVADEFINVLDEPLEHLQPERLVIEELDVSVPGPSPSCCCRELGAHVGVRCFAVRTNFGQQQDCFFS